MSKYKQNIASKAFSLIIVFIFIVSCLALGYSAIKVNSAQFNNTVLETSTYLGDAGDDYTGGVKYDLNGNIIVALNSTKTFTEPTNSVDGGGNGMLIKMNNLGTQIISVTRVAEWVDNFEINKLNGTFAVATNDGIKVISSDLQTLIFSDQINSLGSGLNSTSGGPGEIFSNGRAVSIGQNGNIAFLSSKAFRVYSPTGTVLTNSNIGNTYVNTIALDTENESIYLGGYTQDNSYVCAAGDMTCNNVPAGGCGQYQSPFIRAFGYNGSEKYREYHWDHSDVLKNNYNLCADSEVMKLKVRNNKLYMLGKSDGGNSIFRQDPRSASTSCGCIVTVNETPAVTYAFTDTFFANGAPTNAWLLKFDITPTSLTPTLGQTNVSRLPSGSNANKTNSFIPIDFEVDSTGSVAMVAEAASEFAHRSIQTLTIKNSSIVNQPLSVYNGGDAVIYVLSADFKQRITGTAVPGNVGQKARGVDILNGNWTYQGRTSGAGGTITSGNALQPTAGGLKDSFLVVKGVTSNTASSSSSSVSVSVSASPSASSSVSTSTSSVSNSSTSPATSSSASVSSSAASVASVSSVSSVSSANSVSSSSAPASASSATSVAPASSSSSTSISNSSNGVSSISSSSSSVSTSSQSSVSAPSSSSSALSAASSASVSSASSATSSSNSTISSSSSVSTSVSSSANSTSSSTSSQASSSNASNASSQTSSSSQFSNASTSANSSANRSTEPQTELVLEIAANVNNQETISTKPLKLKNGQIARNIDITVFIKNPSGKTITVKTKTNNEGSLVLKIANNSLTIADLLTSIKVNAADYELLGGTIKDLQEYGQYSAYSQLADSDGSIKTSNTIYWQKNKPSSAFGLPRSGNIGLDFIIYIIPVILTIATIYFIVKRVKKS
jgi:hypothetical protein